MRRNKTGDDGKVTRLDIRMHPQLKKELQKYCDTHLESITEAVTNAIKKYIGFKGNVSDR